MTADPRCRQKSARVLPSPSRVTDQVVPLSLQTGTTQVGVVFIASASVPSGQRQGQRYQVRIEIVSRRTSRGSVPLGRRSFRPELMHIVDPVSMGMFPTVVGKMGVPGRQVVNMRHDLGIMLWPVRCRGEGTECRQHGQRSKGRRHAAASPQPSCQGIGD